MVPTSEIKCHMMDVTLLCDLYKDSILFCLGSGFSYQNFHLYFFCSFQVFHLNSPTYSVKYGMQNAVPLRIDKAPILPALTLAELFFRPRGWCFV